MQLKFVIIFTLLVCLSSKQVNLLNINEDLLDKARESYDKLKEKIQRTIDDCVEKLNFRLIKTFNLADQSISDGTRKIVNVTDEYTTKLDELTNKNKKNKQCIDKIKSEIFHVRDNMIDDLNTCIKGLVYKANMYIDTTIMKINSTWDIVEKLGVKLDACGNDRLCLSKMRARIIVESVRLPLKITGNRLKGTVQLTKIDLKIGTCKMSKTLLMTIKGGKLFASAANCTH